MKDKTKDVLQKIAAFAVICLYGLGLFGGLGWTLYNRDFLLAVGVLALGAMAVPTLMKAVNILTDPGLPPKAGAK